MNGFSTIKTITRRELASYFNSPVAYVFIVIFLALCGIFTFLLGGFFERGEASLVRPFFDWHPWLYLFLVPAAGNRGVVRLPRRCIRYGRTAARVAA